MFKSHVLAGVALASASLCTTTSLFAADHLDAPGVMGQPQADINDLYAFQSPNNPDNTVLILTVNPFAGSTGPTGGMSPTTFSPTVNYDFLIDNDGDAVADVAYTTTFSNTAGGQALTTSRTANGTTVNYASGGVGSGVTTSGGGTIQAGTFDDPFFFDFAGFNDGLNFTGTDSFAGANVSAIVLEIPSAELGANNVGIYATTTEDGNQIDRIGRPAINTVLIPSGMKDAFNRADPVNDPDNFSDEFIATITALSGDPDFAASLTMILAPDLLTYDATSAAGFLNGRRLSDDVIDAELALLTQGALTGDGVDTNDVAFLSLFPYLAPAQRNGSANVIPTPGAAAAGLALLGLMAARRRSRDASRV